MILYSRYMKEMKIGQGEREEGREERDGNTV